MENSETSLYPIIYGVWKLRMLALLALIWLLPTLACGSFQPRPTPTFTPIPIEDNNTAGAQETLQPTVTPTLILAPSFTETPTPTPTFTETPVPGSALAVGQPARVTAPNGLNLRSQASSGGQLIIQLGTGQLVTILEGPVETEGYTWWRLEDGQGNSGWAADGDGETEWLSPRVGEAQPVSRLPQVGDRVLVTMDAGIQLTIRALPGRDAPLVTRVDPGTQFTVINGPQTVGGLNWYQIRSDDGRLEGWAAAGDGNNRWLSL
ncbi:MAG: SH3 domain-containing protein, partial [Caldilineaceae bacterium]|nr:SH3 domain-containing protein [Caldilineaceae bacterium]